MSLLTIDLCLRLKSEISLNVQPHVSPKGGILSSIMMDICYTSPNQKFV